VPVGARARGGCLPLAAAAAGGPCVPHCARARRLPRCSRWRSCCAYAADTECSRALRPPAASRRRAAVRSRARWLPRGTCHARARAARRHGGCLRRCPRGCWAPPNARRLPLFIPCRRVADHESRATCNHYLLRACRCPALVARRDGATPSHTHFLARVVARSSWIGAAAPFLLPTLIYSLMAYKQNVH
jgi:hypothetical protein